MSALANPTAGHQVLNVVPKVDRLVFTDRGRGVEVQDDPAMRLELVRDSVAEHLNRCAAYARFAQRSGFELDMLHTPDDLERVPQLPTTVFKRVSVLSRSAEQIAKRCTSSGTQGRLSVVHRDRTTIERLLGSVRRGIELLGDWHEDDVRVVNLGPSQQEAGDLWFSYVMSLVELVYTTQHALSGNDFDTTASLEALEAFAAEAPSVVLIGPPALVMRVAHAAAKRGGPRVEGLTVVTAGGWKRGDGKLVDRDELTQTVGAAFGLSAPSQVRDAFNQVELNTVLMECASHRKHVPPWLHVTARSLKTLKPLPVGTPGLLSYLDPSAASYPCFIIADDVGLVREQPCDCGWPGRTLEIQRRLERAEHWGCALKMDRTWGKEVV